MPYYLYIKDEFGSRVCAAGPYESGRSACDHKPSVAKVLRLDARRFSTDYLDPQEYPEMPRPLLLVSPPPPPVVQPWPDNSEGDRVVLYTARGMYVGTMLTDPGRIDWIKVPEYPYDE